MSHHTCCLICNSDRIHRLNEYFPKHQLLKCKDCDFVFMEKIPTEVELDEHYAKYDYSGNTFLSPLTVKRYDELLKEFEKYRETNRILDVGCGRGWFLQVAKQHGWEVYGTEYSDEAIKLNRSKGIQIEQGSLQASSFEGMQFDVVTSFEVIEHINNPIEEIRYIHKLLRKGGLFYCTTPNFNAYLRYYLKEEYNVIGYPEHLSYYTKNTLKKLLKDQHFKPIKLLSTGISISRYRTSKQNTKEKLIAKDSQDEKLRAQIEGKWYLEKLKSAVNYLLNLFGLGISLKGYFVKK